MKQLLYIALISIGLITQPVVFAMSQAVDMSSPSQTDNLMVKDDGHSIMAMQMASQDMVISDVSDDMPCHASSSTGLNAKVSDAQDCNDCCESDCLAANHCLTSCTISPFDASRTSGVSYSDRVKVISAFLAAHTLLRRPSVIFHPPKHS